MDRDPLIRLTLGIVGGAALVFIFPKAFKFAFKTALSIGLQALPIVIAGLLAEKAADSVSGDDD